VACRGSVWNALEASGAAGTIITKKPRSAGTGSAGLRELTCASQAAAKLKFGLRTWPHENFFRWCNFFYFDSSSK
jgi:hypothetical protein